MNLVARIAAKKAALDRLCPLETDALAQVRKHYDVEMTYTSNAIEGNTLTYRETAEVIEHGITVGGKSLRDHLEAVDHYGALQWMRAQADTAVPLGEATVTELHRRIVARSRPEIAGLHRTLPRHIAGSSVIFPNAAKIPALMQALGAALAMAAPDPRAAFDAHFRLTAIHPFADGNGRTARLLMNLMLLRSGHPPIAVRPEDRAAYLAALEQGSLRGDEAAFRTLLFERLEATLDDYLAVVGEARDA